MKPGRKLTRLSGTEAIAVGTKLRCLAEELRVEIMDHPDTVTPNRRRIMADVRDVARWLEGDRDNNLFPKPVHSPALARRKHRAMSAATLSAITLVKECVDAGVSFHDACRRASVEQARMSRYLIAQGYVSHVASYNARKEARALGAKIPRRKPQQDKITDDAVDAVIALIDGGATLKVACAIIDVRPKLMGARLAQEGYTLHLDRNKERVKAFYDLRTARFKALREKYSH